MSLFKRVTCCMERQNGIACGFLSAAMLCLGLGYCLAEGPGLEKKTIEGRVKSMTTAPKGEVDGAVLDDGSTLHWPPHLQNQFTVIVTEGARIHASGRMETGPKGETHFEVETVTNTDSNQSFTNDDFRDGPHRPPHTGPEGRPRPPRPEPRADDVKHGEVVNVSGTVQRFTTAPRGETDGAILSDGTILHWPPHLENRFTSLLKIGDQVRASGRREVAPRGEEHFEVHSVTNTRDGKSVENAAFNGPEGGTPGRKGPSVNGDKRFDRLQRMVNELQQELDRLRREE